MGDEDKTVLARRLLDVLGRLLLDLTVVSSFWSVKITYPHVLVKNLWDTLDKRVINVTCETCDKCHNLPACDKCF